MKSLTVQEYAKFAGIKLATAYKRVSLNQVKWERKFGRIVVKVVEHGA